MAYRSRMAVHPVLFGCLFVLQGYAQLQPMGSARDLVFYLLFISGAILALQLIMASWLRHPRKPAILTSMCVVYFCFIGGWRMQLGIWALGTSWLWLTRMRWLLPLSGTVFLCAGLWVIRTRRTLATTRIYLDAVSALLVAVTLAGIFTGPAAPVLRRGKLADEPLILNEHPPDVYFILTDAYTSPESLKAYWDYDDSPFVHCLTGLGFQVIKNAHSNATFTPVCLATYLDMKYPVPPAKGWVPASGVAWCCKIIEQAEAPSRLKASGYDVRALSIFAVAGQPRYYTFPGIGLPTLAGYLRSRLASEMMKADGMFAGFAEMNVRLFSLLPQIAAERSDKPKFVYAHIMMPHWPYLFDKEGRHVRRGTRPEDGRPEDYLGQLIYENSLITNAVAGILKNSKTPPIIILQGDHGYRSLPGPHKFEEGTTILNALYLPNSQAQWLYPGITPVNTFRLIFNHYFGQHYKYLPDVVPSPENPNMALPEDN